MGRKHLNKNGEGRDFFLDVTRFIAILCVIMLHVSVNYIHYQAQTKAEVLVGTILNGLTQAGVPLFLMISGALLLNEKKSYTTVQFLKKALEFFVLGTIWALLYAVFQQIVLPKLLDQPIVKMAFWEALILGATHLWYMYVIVGLYLIMPFLRCFCRKENARLVLYFIALALVFQFLTPILNFLGNLIGGKDLYLRYVEGFRVSYVLGYTTYFLVGWYIKNIEINVKFKRLIYIVGGIAVIVIVLGEFFGYGKNGLFNNLSIFNFTYSVAFFLCMHNVFSNKQVKLLTAWEFKGFANLAFGVYLIHPALMIVIGFALEKLGVAWGLLGLFFEFFIVVAVSFLLAFVISKIPFVKRLIRG